MSARKLLADPSAAPLARLMAEIARQEATIREGAGKGAIKRQHEKNRLTARERIAKLLDR